MAENGVLEDSFEGTLKALKLIEYYLQMRADESLVSLKELIKISG